MRFPAIVFLAVSAVHAKLTFYSDTGCNKAMPAYGKASVPALQCGEGVNGVKFGAFKWTGPKGGSLVFFNSGVNGVGCSNGKARNGLWEVYLDGDGSKCFQIQGQYQTYQYVPKPKQNILELFSDTGCKQRVSKKYVGLKPLTCHAEINGQFIRSYRWKGPPAVIEFYSPGVNGNACRAGQAGGAFYSAVAPVAGTCVKANYVGQYASFKVRPRNVQWRPY